ncbi:hypothetical protein MAM1_0189c07612 [Mucor ambiguus]|uniref:Uncharacterized protein n=1 Tax=Mucor ambiguus TaxID=91626 RepID=A0A0C9LW89_9FUNG|nr:hypothetical protein MAM1_0189c07612 [Mucor ambiguus]
MMILSLGARCCCDCRSLAVLAMLSLGILALFAAAVAVYQLSWCCHLVGTCFCCLLSFACCLGTVYCCCCCSLNIAILVMHSLLGKLVQLTAAVSVYLLSWRSLGVRFFCCCCHSFSVLVMLYRINLVLSAAASIYWLCW